MAKIDAYTLKHIDAGELREQRVSHTPVPDDEMRIVTYEPSRRTCYYKCPCGCGRMVVLFLRPCQTDGPTWAFSEQDGKPTLSPSVLELAGCKSHYFITNGQVRWC